MSKKKILIVFGTRPEAIKMAPLYKALRNQNEEFEVLLCVTGQHRELLDQVLELFEMRPDYDLNIMKPQQDLYDITTSILCGMKNILLTVQPDIVLVHGDTTTSTATALACYYQQIKVGHIEAGLRTNNIYSPFPEEMNRQLTSRIASFHFAPTEKNKHNLLKENIAESNIVVTGNTVIDALHIVIEKINNNQQLQQHLVQDIQREGYNVNRLIEGKKIVLITGHRRENFGKGFADICSTLKILCEKYPEVDFVYPMHLNPNVRKPVLEAFGKSQLHNIFLINPLQYLSFVFLMEKASIILTDSGGIQEEAPSLKKPVLVMRNTTERQEAIEAGTVKLVGTHPNVMIVEISKLLDCENCYEQMSNAINPYGDGNACRYIIDFLKNNL